MATANKVFAMARKTEAQDLATRTAAAIERAKSHKARAEKVHRGLGRHGAGGKDSG
ncbi:hypothetical protein GCM10020000_11760 [Streptomyces olivoverticillatus]